jgi:two-component system, sensor histidine kinase and response regulator
LTNIKIMNLSRENGSILVVDDQPDNFDTIEMLLSQDGYCLHYTDSGFGALAYLHENQPDLILMDVMMPGMSGLETTQRIKCHPQWQHIPIIIVTALTSKVELTRCLDAGADDFISKPVNRLELQARVRSMLRVRRQYLALEDALKLRTDLANMLVHDLRSPLAAIMMSCDLMQRYDVSEKQRRPIYRITTASRQLQSMIDSLLTLAKLEAGQLILQPEATDLSHMLRQVIQDFQIIAAQKRLQIVGQFPESTHRYLLDQTIFRRVLDNLVSNAIKFSPLAGTITLSLTYPQPDHPVVQVIDQGKGIPDALKQVIFEKFEVGETVRGITQTGLGLAFCKMAIAAHGGTLDVMDNHPHGAIFSVTIGNGSC